MYKKIRVCPCSCRAVRVPNTHSTAFFVGFSPLATFYHYDQLNRIKQQHATDEYRYDSNDWKQTIEQLDYFMQFDYDPNGNILSMQRNGNATMNHNGLGTHALEMDNLKYNYNYDVNGNLKNNQLRYVSDAINDGEYSNDIDNQKDNNYLYDEIGNLIHDEKGKIETIEWTLYGKIKKVKKTNGNILTFAYDAAGNRIKKETEIKGVVTATYYTRDAQGNVLAVYTNDQDGNNDFYLSEVPLYGSSRLGEWRPRRLLDIAAQENTVTTASGEKTYELANHLGNVLAVVSDALIDDAPSVVSATDYYAFGQEMPGRTFASEDYRYGFNGKENDREWGESLIQDYGLRLYNPALCRFLSVDPLYQSYPWNSTYAFAENDVIRCIDLDGGEKIDNNTPPPSGITALRVAVVPSGLRNYDSTIKLKYYELVPVTTTCLKDFWVARRNYPNGMHQDQYIVGADAVGDFIKQEKRTAEYDPRYSLCWSPTVIKDKHYNAFIWAHHMSGGNESLYDTWKSTWTTENVITGALVLLSAPLALGEAGATEIGMAESGSIESGAAGAIERVKIPFNEKIAKDVATINKNADPYLDCSDIASQLNRHYEGGYILEITPRSGKIINGIEYGTKTEFTYHQVFVRGKYVYDPMFSSKPIETGTFLAEYKTLNPNGINLSKK